MIAALLVATLTGCMNNPLQAPSTAAIVAPASVKLAWGDSYNGLNDGLGAVILGDFYVYDTVTDMPLENIKVEVTSNSSGTYIVPPEALKRAAYPEIPEGYSLNDCVDDNGNFDSSVYEWCAWVYDTVTGEYYEITGDYADNDSSGQSYRPNYMLGTTDGSGLLRVYVYVDYLFPDGESFANSQIVGSIGHDSSYFEVGPGTGN
ncbi:MAG: hypothetical protein D6798_06770 [Deltaproteobacteria bacterium]|nr:MAG: hypothetical protein D6798_06770 [Deltaproteobacteria bacterium]